MDAPWPTSRAKASLPQAWGVMWATRRMVGEKTSSGTMQPPSAPRPRPRSSETPIACCSLRNSVPTKIPAPAAARANTITTAATPAGAPQLTPKSSAEPRMMTSAWTQAISTRPRVSPATTVAADVGVASIRRDTPSLRVSIRATAPVIAMRNRNSRSSVQAPSSNWPRFFENSAAPAVVWVTETEGTAGAILVAAARPASKLGAACCVTANRAAPSRAACRATAPRTVSPSCWEDWSGRAR